MAETTPAAGEGTAGDEPYPMGPEEIRVRLGVSRQWAYTLIGRKDFPDPWRELAMGAVWRSTDVERYAVERAKRLAKGEGEDE
ncbi:DNA-binding protein [Actinoplanes sp. NPDC049802]|uniref:DNA-binding protein n=1 Tax=Actinoplanes sp. NPDC049802 TaxID=3154742 RepID=UPI00340F4852